MEKDYSDNIIKDFRYWTVYAHENQGYLGRCVVWCKRENALDLCDATPEEREELFTILPALRAAATHCFQPDWFNYAFLGNLDRHLHAHFIPRYATPRTFAGVIFEDTLYGQLYKTDTNFVTPVEVHQGIKNKMIAGLREAS